MTKYLAVIKDSFREAFASRVLWLLIIVITLVLGLIAPFGFKEVITTKISENDLRDPWELMNRIRNEGQQNPSTPSGKILALVDPKYRARLIAAKLPGIDREQGNPFEAIGVFNDFVRQVNKVLEQSNFYDEEAWKDIPVLSSEAMPLVEQHREGKLAPQELPRFNRLMLEAAFSGLIRESPPTSVQWKYGWMDMGSPDPLSSRSIHDAIENNAARVLKWLVGVVGILIAILVTSPIIPQMFDQGSLHLLLSKPVSRWMLLLAKFFGGCAFIFLSATYLILGLWLILGVRFGIWQPRLLLSIPIYLFVFTIYYSISALAGVVWRSPIVSVALSVLFWLVCFGLGWAVWIVESAYLKKDRFIQVIEAGDSVIATNEMGWSFEWDKTKSEWKQVFTSNDQRGVGFVLRAAPAVPRELRAIGPVHDRSGDRLVAAVPVFPSRMLNLAIGTRKTAWESTSKTSAPMGTSKLLVEPSGKVLIVSSLGLSRLTGDPLAERKPVSVFGFNLPGFSSGPLQDANPEPLIYVTAPSDAAINQQTGQLAIYTRGTIIILAPNKSRYTKVVDKRLDGEERQSAVLAFGGKHLLVGRFDGRVQAFDPATLESVAEYDANEEVGPRFMEASPDGRWFSLLFHNSRLTMFDANKLEFFEPRVQGQGNISAANFTPRSTLLVADRGDRVNEYSLDPLQSLPDRRLSPSVNLFRLVYRYGLWPMYMLFPKPSELDTTFDHVLNSGEDQPSNPTLDLFMSRDETDPWTPVWTSAAFTLAVLLIACVYIQFQEF